MDEYAAKANLHNYLKHEREAVLAKLNGLSEYDVRRPLTVTGTNLLGLVKHLATWETRYLGEAFGRPFPEPFLAGTSRPSGSPTCGRRSTSHAATSSTVTGACGRTAARRWPPSTWTPPGGSGPHPAAPGVERARTGPRSRVARAANG